MLRPATSGIEKRGHRIRDLVGLGQAAHAHQVEFGVRCVLHGWSRTAVG